MARTEGEVHCTHSILLPTVCLPTPSSLARIYPIWAGLTPNLSDSVLDLAMVVDILSDALAAVLDILHQQANPIRCSPLVFLAFFSSPTHPSTLPPFFSQQCCFFLSICKYIHLVARTDYLILLNVPSSYFLLQDPSPTHSF